MVSFFCVEIVVILEKNSVSKYDTYYSSMEGNRQVNACREYQKNVSDALPVMTEERRMIWIYLNT